MLGLHWAEWAWVGAMAGLALIWGLHLLLFHRAHSDGSAEEPVGLGSLQGPLPRVSRQPFVVAEGQRCPCCHGDLALQEGLHRCPRCSTVLHWECHRELGCPTLGCAGGFAPAQVRASDRLKGADPQEPQDDEPRRAPAKHQA